MMYVQGLPRKGQDRTVSVCLQPAVGGDVRGSALRCSGALLASFLVDPSMPVETMGFACDAGNEQLLGTN